MSAASESAASPSKTDSHLKLLLWTWYWYSHFMDSDARGFRTAARRRGRAKGRTWSPPWLARQGLPGVLLSTQHNFSWLSAGGSNRVDGSARKRSGDAAW